MTEGIEESLLGFVEGDCSPDEAAAIQAWIAADPRRGELLDEVRAVWRLTGSSTRQWVVAEARVRLLRSRGRHAAQGSAGFSGRPGPISQVAETNPKGTPGIARGRRGYHHYDRAAWVVAEPDGTGMVLAALSPDSLRFDEFVRAAAWDSAALVPTWSGADAAGSMSDIVQRMLGDGYFNYDLVTYSVAPPVYAQQDLTPQQQDLTQQGTAPAYDAYPTCLNCTFIGEQLLIYVR